MAQEKQNGNECRSFYYDGSLGREKMRRRSGNEYMRRGEKTMKGNNKRRQEKNQVLPDQHHRHQHRWIELEDDDGDDDDMI